MKQRMLIMLILLLLILMTITVAFNIQTPPALKPNIQADSDTNITTEDVFHQIDTNIISMEVEIDVGDLL